MLQIEKPYVIFAILFLIPSILVCFLRIRKIANSLDGFYSDNSKETSFHLKFSIFFRTMFRCLSFICAVLAYAGISWGVQNIPVQKKGCAVSFVFDISNSMLANDAQNNLSRLDAAKIYALNIIEKLDGASYSVVIAKGDGFVAVPQTEDKKSFESLLQNLTPQMMTSKGSSIGKGIQAAINAFPQNSGQNNFMLVFTDGDETDNQMEAALSDCARFQIPVYLIGFGSEKGVEIEVGEAGKDRTKVKTYLQSKKMKEICDSVNGKATAFTNGRKTAACKFVDSKTTGSAASILSELKKYSSKGNGTEASGTFTYETRPVKRHKFFLGLAVLFLILSFFAGEFSPHKKSAATAKKTNNAKKIAGTLMIFSVFLGTSCSKERSEILNGTWAHYNGNYSKATSSFFRVANTDKDTVSYQYGLFDLSSTYLSLEEYDAAMERLEQINTDDPRLPSDFKSAVHYNKGIILQHSGDYSKAGDAFKAAILADGSNLNAKINLELCNRELEAKNATAAQTEMQGTSINEEKDESLEQEIFNMIRENEDNQWKKMESGAGEDNVLDY